MAIRSATSAQIARALREPVTIKDRVEGAKLYCIMHYDNGWCDLVIETLGDWDIADIIENTNTVKGAVHKLAVHFGPYAEQRKSVMNEVF